MAKKDFVPLEELMEAQDARSVISKEMNNDRDLANQLLGQIKMAQSFSIFANVISTAQLKNIKENKLYKALDGKTGVDINGNKIANVGTWEGFCQAVGVSRAKADDDILNLNTFGEEALKQLSAVGAGYRELRQFRKLPEDEKQALIEVAKEGDKEGFAEVAETIIAKHAKEKEALTKQLEDVKLDLEASRATANKKEATLLKTENELEKLKVRIQKMTPVELGEQLREEATRTINKVEVDIRGNFYNALKALFDHQTQTGVDHSSLMTGFLTQIKRAVNDVAIALDIQEAFDDNPVPEFLRDDAEESLKEATRKAYEEAGVDYE